MGIINNTFLYDEYIQIPNLKKFAKEHGLHVSLGKPDLIKEVEKYAGKGQKEKQELVEWALKTIKAGSKEFCYRKIYHIEPKHRDPVEVKEMIAQIYPNCPFENLLEYKNTDKLELIDYEIVKNNNGQVEIVSFIFSSLVFETARNPDGDKIIYPIFVDVFMESGFVFTRQKPKATIYNIPEAGILLKENHITTDNYANDVLSDVIKCLDFAIDQDTQDVRLKSHQMQYKLYEKYAITPMEVLKKMTSIKSESIKFANEVFDKLNLTTKNLDNAIKDLEIFAEKYISINGEHEEDFKNVDEAYLVKVVTGNAQEMTKMDTTSALEQPLQCTEAFYDSKKATMKSKKCDKLHLCYKRIDDEYHHNKSIPFQFSAKKKFGLIKSVHFAEEEDIKRVLQTVIENY